MDPRLAGGRRPGAQLGRRAPGDQPAAVDDGHAVRQRLGLLDEVGRQQDGGAIRAERPQQVPRRSPGGHVHGCGRLVEDGQLGPPDDRKGEVQALPLTARQGSVAVVGPIGQPDLVEDHARRERRGVERGEEPDGLEDLDLVVEVVPLEHDADLRPQERPIGLRVEAEHRHLAFVGTSEALDDLDRGRLAGAVRTQEGDDLTALDAQVQAVQDRPPVVALDQVPDGDGRPAGAHGADAVGAAVPSGRMAAMRSSMLPDAGGP